MNNRFTYIVLFFGLFSACTNSNTTGSENEATQHVQTTVHWSTMETPKGFREAGNWCFNHFSDAVLISAPPQNSNQRFFDLEDGLYKIVVDKGKPTASFFLKKTGDQPLELFGSQHFPQCLSQKGNYTLRPNGFEYDNAQTIHFSVDCIPNGSQYRVEVNFPLAAGYGIAVHRCTDCF